MLQCDSAAERDRTPTPDCTLGSETAETEQRPRSWGSRAAAPRGASRADDASMRSRCGAQSHPDTGYTLPAVAQKGTSAHTIAGAAFVGVPLLHSAMHTVTNLNESLDFYDWLQTGQT